MARFTTLCFVLFTVLAVTLAQTSQGQGSSQGQAQPTLEAAGIPQWTSCDMTTTPKISCQDCNTRLICKPIGGLLKNCSDPSRPYCNNGICSAVPSADCA